MIYKIYYYLFERKIRYKILYSIENYIVYNNLIEFKFIFSNNFIKIIFLNQILI